MKYLINQQFIYLFIYCCFVWHDLGMYEGGEWEGEGCVAAMEFGLTDTLNTKAFNKPIEQVLFLSTILSVHAFKLKLKTNEECFKLSILNHYMK